MIHLSPVEQGAGINTATLDIKSAVSADEYDKLLKRIAFLEETQRQAEEVNKELAQQPDPWLETVDYRLRILRRKAFALGE